MGNFLKPRPPQRILRCCYHLKYPQRGYQCSNFIPFLSPCCIHKQNNITQCNFKLLVQANMFVNGTMLAAVILKIIELTTDSYLVNFGIIIALAAYLYQKKLNLKKQQIQRMVIIVVCIIVLRVFSSIFNALIPDVLFSFWPILLATLLFLYLLSVQLEKSQVKHQVRDLANTRKLYKRQPICCVCLDRKTTHAILPCLHASYCGLCVKQLNKCALCRVNINSPHQIQLVD